MTTLYSLRRHVLLFIFVFVFFSISPAFGNNIDSLQQELETLEGKEKLSALVKLTWGLKHKDPKLAIDYGMQGLELARILKDDKKEADILGRVGIIYQIKGDYDLSEDFLLKAVDLFQEQKNVRGIGKTTIALGSVYMAREEHNSALAAYERAKTLYEAQGDSSNVITINGNIGSVYYKLGQYEKALPLYKESLDFMRKKNKATHLIITWEFNLGLLYMEMGKYSKALDHLFEVVALSKSIENRFYWLNAQNSIGLVFQRLELHEEALQLYQNALKEAEAMDNQSLTVNMYNNLGLCHFYLNKWDESIDYYNKSLETARMMNKPRVGNTLNNLGNSYWEKGQGDRAIDFYRQAIENDSLLNLENEMALGWLNLGDVYLKQGKFLSAETYLLKAFKVWDQIKDIDDLSLVTERLSELYEKLNNAKEETRFKKMHQSLSDSLFNKDKVLKINQTIIREKIKDYDDQIYQFNEKISLLEKENTSITQKFSTLITILIVALVLLGFLFFRYRKTGGVKEQKLAQQLSRVQSKNDDLEKAQEEQNRELVVISLDMIQKQEILKTIKSQLSSFAKKNPNNAEIRSLLNKLKINDILSKDWLYFNELFNKVFPDFIANLKEEHPKLSRKELQHYILIKLNISSTETANILGISVESLHTSRYRLRKKLGLPKELSLEESVLNF